MIRIEWSNEQQAGDLAGTERGYETQGGIVTAVLLSLFVDARADADEVPEHVSRRGYWADPEWGSKLWLVFLRKADNAALRFAQQACERALDWMIEDGVAESVTVETWWLENRKGYLGILVTLKRPDEPAPMYIGPWEVYYAVD